MTIFKNINIGKRLGLGFAAILAFSLSITAISIWQLQALAGATREMTLQPLAKERMIADWHSYIASAIRRTTAVAKSSDPSLGAYFAEDTATGTNHTAELQKKIEPLLSSAEETQLYKKIMDQRTIFLSSRSAIFRLKASGQIDQANQVFQATYLPCSITYQALIQALLDMQHKQMDATADAIDAAAAASRHLLSALAIAVLAFGIACAWWLTAGITRPLRRAVEAARRVADGDLTGEIVVDSSDETGQLLQTLKDMNHSLWNIVSDVRRGSDTIATASGQIAAGNMDLSSRTEQQANSLEETAASMDELTITVGQNADHVRQANSLAASASDVALKGGAAVSQVIHTMASIDGSSKKIVEIISVIDAIAFQTNILALNAAVEAARAGEQGRGFAVVAAEVRNLAQRSAAAAKEIKALIGDSVDKVAAGSRLVLAAGSTMDDVLASVRRVTDIMGDISAAGEQQRGGIEQVNQAIAHMDAVTRQNAALVEESAAAAQSLRDQAANLSRTVGVFQLDGTRAAVRPTRSPQLAAPARKLAGTAPSAVALTP